MTPDTRQILEHIARYHLTTIDAVHSLYYRDKTREAARVCLYRLTASGYLKRFEIQSRSIYRLTPKGCRALDISLSLSRPFDTQALRERYGVLIYCSLREPQRTRLMPQEFAEFFPTLARTSGVKPELQHYFIDQANGRLRLGRILVDGGTPSGRLVRKCRELVKGMLDNAVYEIIAQGNFALTLLTAEATKQQALRSAFDRHPLPIPVTVEPLPELKHVLS